MSSRRKVSPTVRAAGVVGLGCLLGCAGLFLLAGLAWVLVVAGVLATTAGLLIDFESRP